MRLPKNLDRLTDDELAELSIVGGAAALVLRDREREKIQPQVGGLFTRTDHYLREIFLAERVTAEGRLEGPLLSLKCDAFTIFEVKFKPNHELRFFNETWEHILPEDAQNLSMTVDQSIRKSFKFPAP